VKVLYEQSFKAIRRLPTPFMHELAFFIKVKRAALFFALTRTKEVK
jgi:hypothetical protein